MKDWDWSDWDYEHLIKLKASWSESRPQTPEEHRTHNENMALLEAALNAARKAEGTL